MSNTDHSQRFLELLAKRDFEGLRSLFAPDATARFLLPRGPEEQLGGPGIVGRFQDWFAAASSFEVTSSDSEAVGARRWLSWQVRLERVPACPETIQQVAFVDADVMGIRRLDLLCSGFHPVAPEPAGDAIFDAGDRGCADGLAEEFRRRITAVPIGSVLRVVASDPAAKEDLPPLARMLGHAVTSTGTLADGRLEFTVERGR